MQCKALFRWMGSSSEKATLPFSIYLPSRWALTAKEKNLLFLEQILTFKRMAIFLSHFSCQRNQTWSHKSCFQLSQNYLQTLLLSALLQHLSCMDELQTATFLSCLILHQFATRHEGVIFSGDIQTIVIPWGKTTILVQELSLWLK